MTEGQTTALKIAGLVIGSAVGGVLLYEATRYAVDKIRYESITKEVDKVTKDVAIVKVRKRK